MIQIYCYIYISRKLYHGCIISYTNSLHLTALIFSVCLFYSNLVVCRFSCIRLFLFLTLSIHSSRRFGRSLPLLPPDSHPHSPDPFPSANEERSRLIFLCSQMLPILYYSHTIFYSSWAAYRTTTRRFWVFRRYISLSPVVYMCKCVSHPPIHLLLLAKLVWIHVVSMAGNATAILCSAFGLIFRTWKRSGRTRGWPGASKALTRKLYVYCI